jgi:N-acyl-D-amino-acid deacylase
MFRSGKIAKTVGCSPPADAAAIIQFMRGQPLDFDPGAQYAYSNFGYCVLGRIVEQITGQSYAQFVRENVLGPCGIKDMRIGASLEKGQAPNEVRYYVRKGGLTEPVFPEVPGKVTWPYGGFHLEAMDAHGGWIASAVDLARFAAALHDPANSPMLKKSSYAVMAEPPAPPVSRKPDGQLAPAFYGCGWMIRPVKRAHGATNYNAWHTGSLPGTATLLVRRWDGLSWAVLFNQRSEHPALPDSAIDPALHRAAAAVRSWPAHDLFPAYS